MPRSDWRFLGSSNGAERAAADDLGPHFRTCVGLSRCSGSRRLNESVRPAEARQMNPAGVRIGHQTSCHVPRRLPYEFAVSHGFDAFEWFSDKGRAGWCEDDAPRAVRAQLLRVAKDNGILFSLHAPCNADPTTQAGTEAILKSIRFGGDVEVGVV